MHSSQKPAEKLPLTKGRTVDTMVKRLNHSGSNSPPPKPNVMVSPNVSVQHNNNQPFSYTRGLSPEKYLSNENVSPTTNPVIYAQVVCGSNGVGTKQTVHTAYTNGKRHPHSDSDEGLGGEESSGFGRKYEHERSVTRFGDDHYTESYRKIHDDYFDEHEDKFKQESPILPKYRQHSYFSRNGHVDMTSRGRGDGMDSKRRESLSEENDINNLSARRDLLESRINRRLNDKSLRPSPEYSPTNVFISETTSKYYRSGSNSPTGYKERYKSETRVDRHGEKYTTESRSKKYFGDDKRLTNGYTSNGFDSEPKSFDSQLSDYRSSPENRQFETSHNRYNTSRIESHQKMFKDRSMYKSTPEIHQSYLKDQYSDSYHDSLRREKNEVKPMRYKSERYLDQVEERKDKFGDSGIENDFRRDSSENYRVPRQVRSRRDYCNESEDEGFASSLLIASEKQHTEENLKKRRDYDSDRDRTHSREDDPLRHSKYIPRERSIDDGSHYDPIIDKEMEIRANLKKVEKKPPKPEKKSSLEKVKSLFTRDSKKKKEKQVEMVREEDLRARYTEYKGREPIESKFSKKSAKESYTSYDYNNRRRLSTPSPSPTREHQPNGDWRNGKSSETNSSNGGWFKSLDRLSRKVRNKEDKDTANGTSTEDELQTSSRPPLTKNLRFFGDTDAESTDGHRPPRRMLNNRSQSTRDLHNISEELRTPDLSSSRKHPSHKSLTNISERDSKSGSRLNLKPPASPGAGRRREPLPPRRDLRRRRADPREPESSTEGDSSQQSQRSVVYLHAATVGDIPDPGRLRNGRRAASREELASAASSGRLRSQSRTLSRSFSVLAPWRPRHPREALEVDYTQQPKRYEKGAKSSRKDSSSTLKKKAQESKKFSSTLNRDRKSRSKENLSSASTLKRSKDELSSKGSTSTLYKKKDRMPRENSRYSSRDKEDKKMSSKCLSVESLGNVSRKSKEDRDISRSISMPRDPDKSAGWFKMSKKTSRTSGSTQRL